MAAPTRRWMIIVTSTIAFAMGYLIARFTYLIGLAGFGWIEGRDPLITAHDVTFQSAGPALAETGGLFLVLGAAIALALIYPGPGPYGVARMSVLWTMIHLFREGLQVIVTAPFVADSAGAKLFARAGLGGQTAVFVSVVAAVVLVGMGMLLAGSFLRFSPERQLVEDRAGRIKFLALVAAVPWIIGSAIVAAVLGTGSGLALGIIVSGIIVLTVLAGGLIVEVPDTWNPTPASVPIVPAVLLAVLIWVFVAIPDAGISILSGG